MTTHYQHLFLDGSSVNLPVGKVVCIGRNYAEHAKELNNPIPSKPLLFIKPNTALADLRNPLEIPSYSKICHHELEFALLIGKPLKKANVSDVAAAIIGYALALDLTLRDLQDELKVKGHPWEMAKAFDNACPISPFIPVEQIQDPQNVDIRLTVNGQLRQEGNTRQMITKINELLAYISTYFTLLPGDVVLTGTPAGVGELKSGDQLLLELENDYSFVTTVA
ncbi:fumarylacetoacetate hydrolase family protein [Beggiatoa leptomitoformis]|uniref:Fumarylacetoacetate hydrolase family protein n=1 Tax=Beggiatoa leptomitoformis TaxID=288004 RepID=A0A2N9YHG7_9GAMM|nr:fumarylacetoacetate hydrolase family protein [Beggiatoa leptomitoformis]ALG67757.1 fumarylacetoacetate hydrolase family protein [Beggiatoa leptomitoformis]AUI70001.1 fumarylacetoacetate hydrolase family protein [Beggiatoa leptomitoformis]